MNTADQNQQSNTELEIMDSSALEAMERASIDIQITTAKRFPRPDFSVIKKKMVSLATLDAETAAGCFYKLERQGKVIEGPSVRMAEVAVSCFQNIRAGSRIIGNDGKTITAQSFCHDLENNVMVAVEVKRRITDKNGRIYSEDMQVVTGNAACAIGFRNAVYKVVPMALIKPVYEAAKRCAVGDIQTLAQRRTEALKYFASLGVNEKKVLAYLGKAGAGDIDLAGLETLIGLSTAIKDGSTTVDEAFTEPAKVDKPSFGKTEEPGAAKPEGQQQGEQTLPLGETTKKPAARKPAEKNPEPAKATPLQGLKNLMKATKVSEASLLKYLSGQGEIFDTIGDLPPQHIESLVANWATVSDDMEKDF